MTWRRRRKAKVLEAQELQKINPDIHSGKRGSIISQINNINKKGFSKQLRGIAENVERFEQIAEIMSYVSIFGSSSQKNSTGLNLGSFLRNGDSLNHMFKAILPVLRNSGLADAPKNDPIQVDPARVKTHHTK